jgi:hypothetical protein
MGCIVNIERQVSDNVRNTQHTMSRSSEVTIAAVEISRHPTIAMVNGESNHSSILSLANVFSPTLAFAIYVSVQVRQFSTCVSNSDRVDFVKTTTYAHLGLHDASTSSHEHQNTEPKGIALHTKLSR